MCTHRKAALAKCAAETLLGWPWPCPWTGPASCATRRLDWQARLVHSHTMQERRDFPTQLACLDGVRGVLRLAGNDIIHFLQVWFSEGGTTPGYIQRCLRVTQPCGKLAFSWRPCRYKSEAREWQPVANDRASLQMTARRYRKEALGRNTARCSTARAASYTTCTCTARVRSPLKGALFSLLQAFCQSSCAWLNPAGVCR